MIRHSYGCPYLTPMGKTAGALLFNWLMFAASTISFILIVMRSMLMVTMISTIVMVRMMTTMIIRMMRMMTEPVKGRHPL